MKHCPGCGSSKELSDFNKDKSRKDGYNGYCRKCANEVSIKYGREVRGYLPMSENKSCAQYLGVAVAERLVRHLFHNVVRMPNNHPGYDFICAKDKKIDVKSACITMHNTKNLHWQFYIKKNQIADFFLLLAFNDRTALEPLHQWLIPGHVVNHLAGASISPSTITKWDEYRQDIGHAVTCCNIIKEM